MKVTITVDLTAEDLRAIGELVRAITRK